MLDKQVPVDQHVFARSERPEVASYARRIDKGVLFSPGDLHNSGGMSDCCSASGAVIHCSFLVVLPYFYISYHSIILQEADNAEDEGAGQPSLF